VNHFTLTEFFAAYTRSPAGHRDAPRAQKLLISALNSAIVQNAGKVEIPALAGCSVLLREHRRWFRLGG